MLTAILVAILLSTIALTTGAEAQAGDCTGTVVLDPGHGGTDSGAVHNNGLQEKVQTLNVARSLKTLLENDGCPVFMTRTEDETLSNTQRANRANTTGAD
ncbi:MAG: N-acetylmuramoyl-L-alanine amidase, partial [Rubrobacteraceae bacterium]|nr:N-acetylmuramoyl-L-alanine amidase [Rubrobacteraceae bacterium]